MRPLLILNPNAGRLQAEPELRLRLANHPLLAGGETHLPASSDDARLLARQARERGFDPVMAGGGDGTVNAVVNGLMDAGSSEPATLAVVPLGTANDFARSLELPDDPVEALELISRAKEAWGPLAYLRTSLGALPDLSRFRTTIRFDGSDPREVNLVSVVIANGRYAGGGIPVGPEARLDDGLLDVTLVPELDLAPMAAVATAILQGEHWGRDDLTTLRARRIHLTSEPPIWLSLDGELLQVKKAAFQVVEGPLRVVRT